MAGAVYQHRSLNRHPAQTSETTASISARFARAGLGRHGVNPPGVESMVFNFRTGQRFGLSMSAVSISTASTLAPPKGAHSDSAASAAQAEIAPNTGKPYHVERPSKGMTLASQRHDAVLRRTATNPRNQQATRFRDRSLVGRSSNPRGGPSPLTRDAGRDLQPDGLPGAASGASAAPNIIQHGAEA